MVSLARTDPGVVHRFAALTRIPNGPRLLAGWLLAAPGQAAVDLVILIALRRATGSFGPGGLAVGLATIGFSLSAALQGRLVARIGLTSVVRLAALALALATIALSLSIALAGPPALVIALSGILGLCQPATGMAVRIAWRSAVPDQEALATAFSYTAAAQDAGYICGPAAFGLLATISTPWFALLCCGAMSVTGALAIGSATIAVRDQSPRSGSVVERVSRPMAAIGTTMFAIGAAMGAIDVSAPALATQNGQPRLGGVLLAVLSLGSLLGGLATGARSWHSPISSRLVAFAALAGLLIAIPAVASNLAIAAVGLLLAGAPLGITLSTAYLLGGSLIPAGRDAVSFSLLGLALNAGGAVGYALGAQLAGTSSAASGFIFSACLLIAAGLGATVTASTPRHAVHG